MFLLGQQMSAEDEIGVVRYAMRRVLAVWIEAMATSFCVLFWVEVWFVAGGRDRDVWD